MEIISKKATPIWGVLLLAVCVVSLVLFTYFPPAKVRRVLFFPGAISSTLSGEVRYITNGDSTEADMERLFEALVLGPVDVHHLRVLPRKNSIQSVLYRDGQVYIDFDSSILIEEQELPLTTEEIIAAVRKTLTWNFPSIRHILFTVEGRQLRLLS